VEKRRNEVQGNCGTLAAYRRQIAEIRKKMREAQASAEPEEVPDYAFATPQGSVRLSALFGGKPDLVVIRADSARPESRSPHVVMAGL
jgi:predicted dithiol-disulfide oxidoreductase (DUF899 family)